MVFLVRVVGLFSSICFLFILQMLLFRSIRSGGECAARRQHDARPRLPSAADVAHLHPRRLQGRRHPARQQSDGPLARTAVRVRVASPRRHADVQQ